MRRIAGLIALSVVIVAPAPLSAFPDGAPWGSADPDGAQNCASCHYAEETILDSNSIAATGLPEKIEASKTYSFTLTLVHADYETMGFLAAASHGAFLKADSENIEVLQAMARSKAPKHSDDTASWAVKWMAPTDLHSGDAVTFDIAINASNDDASPFGDVIHYRKIQVPAK